MSCPASVISRYIVMFFVLAVLKPIGDGRSIVVAAQGCNASEVAGWNAACSASQGECMLDSCMENKSIAAIASGRISGADNAALSSCLSPALLNAVIARCNANSSSLIQQYTVAAISCSAASSSPAAIERCLGSLPCRTSLSLMCSSECLAASLACLVQFNSSSSSNCSLSRSNATSATLLLSAICRTMLWQDVSSCNICGNACPAAVVALQCEAAVGLLEAASTGGSTSSLSVTTVYILGACCAAGVAVVVGLSIVCIVRLSQRRRQQEKENRRNGNYRSTSTKLARDARRDEHQSKSRNAAGSDSDEDSNGIHTPPPIRRDFGYDGGARSFVNISPADRPLQADSLPAARKDGPFSFGQLLLESSNRAQGGDWEDGRQHRQQAGTLASAPVQRFVADDDDDDGVGAFTAHFRGSLGDHHDSSAPAVRSLSTPDREERFPTTAKTSGLAWKESHWRPTLGQFESPAKSTPSKGGGGVGCYAVNEYALYSEEEDDDGRGFDDDQLRVNPFEDDDDHDVNERLDNKDEEGKSQTVQSQQQAQQQQQQGSMSLGELEFAFTERSQSSHGTDILQPQSGSRPGSEAPAADALSRKGSSKMSRRNNSANSRSSRGVPRSPLDPCDVQRKEIVRLIVAGSYRRGRLLGRGASGSVYQAIFQNGLVLACKEVDVQQRSAEEISKMAHFFELFTKMIHPHLIQCYAVTYDAATHSLLQWMELVKGGSLHRLARKASGIESRAATPISKKIGDSGRDWSSSGGGGGGGGESGLSEPVVAEYAKQILSALALMHTKGIVHRDIKGSNVLLTGDRRHARIIDFDSATLLLNSCSSHGGDASSRRSGDPEDVAPPANPPSVVGTPLWMAPEIITGKYPCTTAADMWSLGITIAELIDGGNPPWPDFDNTWSAMLHLASTNARPSMPVGVSSELRTFLQRCWETEPSRRANVTELFDHPWLQCRCGSPELAQPASRDASIANSEVQSVASSCGGGLGGQPSSVGNLSSLGRGGGVMGHNAGDLAEDRFLQ